MEGSNEIVQKISDNIYCVKERPEDLLKQKLNTNQLNKNFKKSVSKREVVKPEDQDIENKLLKIN